MRGLVRRVAILLVLAAGGVARADDAQPSPERLKSAAEEFDRGRRAYLARDYGEAAVHFENAYRDAPRAETLRLAIRARREAKQLARAATLAAVAARRYATDAATSQLATQTLDEVSSSLQEYAITCSADCSVTADGRVVSQGDAQQQRIFLDPGPHDLGVGFPQGSVAQHVEAKKGGKDALSFDPPPPAAAPPPAPAPPPPAPPPAPEPEPPHKPLSPVVFWVAAGVTVAVGGVTVLSGIDTQNNPGVDTVRRECAGKDDTCPAYQDGRASQLRTNILLISTGGAVVVTGLIGLFFTDWRGSGGPKSATVGVGPGGVSVAGHF